MTSRMFDPGVPLAVLLAASLSVLVLWIGAADWGQDLDGSGLEAAYWAFGLTGLAGAWFGAWAWWRRRRLLAALGCVVSVLAPVGYVVEITGPWALGLAIASLYTGSKEWRARRRPAAPFGIAGEAKGPDR